MKHFLWLDQVQPSHSCIVGDQALSLSFLMQRGFPVAGGVVSTIAFEQFLGSIDWLDPLFSDFPHSTLHLGSDAKQLQAIARQLRDRIAATPLKADWLPDTWQTPALLLRPQVLHAGAIANDWLAPQVCWATPDAIATALKRVWSEVFRAKSLLFWQRVRSGSPSGSRLPLAEIQLAVLVQPISAAIASGRMRLSGTVLQGQPGLDGLSGLSDTMLVDLLQGSTSPHHFQLNSLQLNDLPINDLRTNSQDRSPDRLPDCLIRIPTAHQPILQPSQIQQLIELAQAIAKETSSSVEFEWLLSDRVWLMQVRSLTQQADNPQQPIVTSETVRGVAASSGQAIGTAWVLDGETIPADLPADAIVIAKRLAIASFHRSSIRGFAIEQGSMTSHSAILARELGIPAIVGAIDVRRHIKTGDRVCLDGDRGLIYRVTSDSVTSDRAPAAKPAASSQAIALSSSQPKLMVNVSQAATIEAIRSVPIAGIGLLRADLLLLDLLQTPATGATSGQIKNRIRPFAEAIYPRPVFYRSLDRSIQASDRPLLGLHGTSGYGLETSWFRHELLALRQLQQEGYDNLQLLLPFVRTVEEFAYCRSQVEQAGLMQPGFQLWIMAEVPSVLFLLPDYVKAGAQGIAIGSNDLTQLLLGIDRDEPQFAHHSALHPAVLQAMHQLIQTAQRLKIPCSICGQAASQPELIALLVEWGISAISVEPQAIETATRAIAAASAGSSHVLEQDAGN